MIYHAKYIYDRLKVNVQGDGINLVHYITFIINNLKLELNFAAQDNFI